MPPTTGIGPGIERMAMIFTDEENIDNVIFFPMMKRVLSSANAAIYGIDELPDMARTTEAVLLPLSEFEELVSDQILRPETLTLKVRLYLRIWKKPALDERWKASGHIEVQGFFKNEPLRIAGYTMQSETEMVPADRG
jgi:hypothetical protein